MESSKKQKYLISSYLAMAAGFIAMLSNFYYMQVLSYAVGDVKGITSTLSTYNITPSSSLLAFLSGSSSFELAVHITYIMLPFTLIMFAIGSFWVLGRQLHRSLGLGMIFSSAIFGMLLALFSVDFYIGPFISIAPFFGVALGLVSGYIGYSHSSKHVNASLKPISIDPQTPYSNMLMISKRFFSKLSGSISVLDMHFDTKAIENMSVFFGSSSIRPQSLRILTSANRLGKHFDRGYFDFKEELSNNGIALELRVMPEEDVEAQHERLIIDEKSAYKIPPINIINRKSEHIVSINRPEALERFETIWKRSTKYENYKQK